MPESAGFKYQARRLTTLVGSLKLDRIDPGIVVAQLAEGIEAKDVALKWRLDLAAGCAARTATMRKHTVPVNSSTTQRSNNFLYFFFFFFFFFFFLFLFFFFFFFFFPEFSLVFSGHSMQAISLLVTAAESVFAVPLAARIHEGLVWCNADKRTLLDKMLGLLGILNIGAPCYFVADAYYAAGKIVKGLLKQGHHLVTRVKSNAVAYAPAGQKKGRRKRGRSKVYGKKIKLKSLLWNTGSMQEVASPVYGERNVILRYRVCDLLWRPAGLLVRFVAVIHPTRGACLLMCTDTSLCALEIIRIYGLRFKIELCFKQAMRLIGTFAYHFWMRDMTPLRYRNGNQYLHRKSVRYQKHVIGKIHAYHVFIQAGVVAQGLLQYLAVVAPKLVWASFGSWLRTIRPGIPPSEFVVANALRHTLPEFLMSSSESDSLAKFIADRQDKGNMRIFRLAS